MNGSAKVAVDVVANINKTNGIDNKPTPISEGEQINGSKVVAKSLPILMKEDFMDPLLGPKPGGISKAQSNLVDVIVRNAVGPHNFIVQDYRQSENLRRLEESMTEFYTEYHKKHPSLTHDDISPNGYYAAKVESHENWVRIRVVKPFRFNVSEITVFLLDHGSYSMTDARQLRQLRRMYVERLPSQAYRAKLHFLGPTGSNWPMDELTRFSKDVEGKPFCAIIVDEDKNDPLYADQIPTFSLVLIDTSGPKDRYVHQDYVKKR